MPIPTIPGEKILDRRRLRYLRETVTSLMDETLSPNRFPGAQPISFASRHLLDLKSRDFFVSEKADGVRVLFFTMVNQDGRPESYLIDRKNDYYFLPFGIPTADGRSHHLTLLDSELVFEMERGQEVLLLMMFDAMVICKENLCSKPLTKRMGRLRAFVITPYMKACDKDPAYRRTHPFRITQKRVELSYNVDSVFKAMKSYHHETDGVIFTDVNAPYSAGTCPSMLKWKPSEENTVDFRVAVSVDGSGHRKYEIEILKDEPHYINFGPLTIDDDLRKEWEKNSPHNRIIECRYDPSWPGNWKFSRYRDDKSTSNHISTYEKIMESIHDNVTKDELETSIMEIYQEWKKRDPSAVAPRSFRSDEKK